MLVDVVLLVGLKCKVVTTLSTVSTVSTGVDDHNVFGNVEFKPLKDLNQHNYLKTQQIHRHSS
jgi:hypothetical protein